MAGWLKAAESFLNKIDKSAATTLRSDRHRSLASDSDYSDQELPERGGSRRASSNGAAQPPQDVAAFTAYSSGQPSQVKSSQAGPAVPSGGRTVHSSSNSRFSAQRNRTPSASSSTLQTPNDSDASETDDWTEMLKYGPSVSGNAASGSSVRMSSSSLTEGRASLRGGGKPAIASSSRSRQGTFSSPLDAQLAKNQGNGMRQAVSVGVRKKTAEDMNLQSGKNSVEKGAADALAAVRQFRGVNEQQKEAFKGEEKRHQGVPSSALSKGIDQNLVSEASKFPPLNEEQASGNASHNTGSGFLSEAPISLMENKLEISASEGSSSVLVDNRSLAASEAPLLDSIDFSDAASKTLQNPSADSSDNSTTMKVVPDSKYIDPFPSFNRSQNVPSASGSVSNIDLKQEISESVSPPLASSGETERRSMKEKEREKSVNDLLDFLLRSSTELESGDNVSSKVEKHSKTSIVRGEKPILEEETVVLSEIDVVKARGEMQEGSNSIKEKPSDESAEPLKVEESISSRTDEELGMEEEMHTSQVKGGEREQDEELRYAEVPTTELGEKVDVDAVKEKGIHEAEEGREFSLVSERGLEGGQVGQARDGVVIEGEECGSREQGGLNDEVLSVIKDSMDTSESVKAEDLLDAYLESVMLKANKGEGEVTVSDLTNGEGLQISSRPPLPPAGKALMGRKKDVKKARFDQQDGNMMGKRKGLGQVVGSVLIGERSRGGKGILGLRRDQGSREREDDDKGGGTDNGESSSDESSDSGSESASDDEEAKEAIERAAALKAESDQAALLAAALMREIAALSAGREALKERESIAEKLALEKEAIQRASAEASEQHAKEIAKLRETMMEGMAAIAVEKNAHTSTRIELQDREAELEAENVAQATALAAAQRVLDEEVERVVRAKGIVESLERSKSKLEQECDELRRKVEGGNKSDSTSSHFEPFVENAALVAEELSRLSWRIEERQTQVRDLEEKFEQLQRVQRQPSEVEQELEHRLKQLIDHLIQKQSQVEALASEKATLTLRLETVTASLKEERATSSKSGKKKGSFSANQEWNGAAAGDEDVEFGLSRSYTLNRSKRLLLGGMDYGYGGRTNAVMGQLNVFAWRLDSWVLGGASYMRTNGTARAMVWGYLVLLHFWVLFVWLMHSKGDAMG